VKYIINVFLVNVTESNKCIYDVEIHVIKNETRCAVCMIFNFHMVKANCKPVFVFS